LRPASGHSVAQSPPARVGVGIGVAAVEEQLLFHSKDDDEDDAESEPPAAAATTPAAHCGGVPPKGRHPTGDSQPAAELGPPQTC
jgi:hypothetical protein